jgi:gas vesicle protein
MADQDNYFGAFLIGFVMGTLVGGITALLLAPQSGDETRTLIHDRSIELKDKAVEKAEAARIKAEAAAADARSRANEIAAELKKRGQSLSSDTTTPATPDVTVEG